MGYTKGANYDDLGHLHMGMNDPIKKKQATMRFQGTLRATSSMTMPNPQISRLAAEITATAAAGDDDDDDAWAFLEYIDAPKWVDFSLKSTRADVEWDDPWFYRSHHYLEAPFEDVDFMPALQIKTRNFSKTSQQRQNGRKIAEPKSKPETPSFADPVRKYSGTTQKLHDELNRLGRSQAAFSGSKSKRVQLQPNLDADHWRFNMSDELTRAKESVSASLSLISLSMQRVSAISSMPRSSINVKMEDSLESSTTTSFSSSSLPKNLESKYERSEHALLHERMKEIYNMMHKEVQRQSKRVSEKYMNTHHHRHRMRSNSRSRSEEEVEIYWAKKGAGKQLRASKLSGEQDGKTANTNSCKLDSIKEHDYSKHRSTSESPFLKVEDDHDAIDPQAMRGGKEILNRQKRSLSRGASDEAPNLRSMQLVNQKLSLDSDRSKKSRSAARASFFGVCRNTDAIKPVEIRSQEVSGVLCSKIKVAIGNTTRGSSQLDSKGSPDVKYGNRHKSGSPEKKHSHRRSTYLSISPLHSSSRAHMQLQRSCTTNAAVAGADEATKMTRMMRSTGANAIDFAANCNKSGNQG